jgi:AraC-like DNA-binding protein
LSAYTSFVAGMHDRPTRTAHDGRQRGVQVRLDPLGAFALFGVPMHELGNRVVELSDLLGADSERWSGRLSEASDWESRFALLDGLLAERMAAGPVPSPEVAWAWRTMRRAGGAVLVSELAEGAGYSHRHLVARFREQVGTTPKIAAQILRYERAARLLAGGVMAPAQVAAVCGYADQSHLTREFSRFAGTTPAMAQRLAP